MTSLYASFMEGENAYIEMTLDLREPVDLFDMVGSFASLGRQFKKFIRNHHEEFEGSARIYLKEVRHGSLIFEFLPLLQPIINSMDQVLIIKEFLSIYYGSISSYFKLGGRAEDVNQSDLKDFLNAVTSIATDPEGNATIRLLESKKTGKTEHFKAHFDTKDAKCAVTEIDKHRKELEHRGEADYHQVVITFEQTNTKDPSFGKRSGERGIIESIDDKPKPILYASPMAGERIKFETVSGDRNPYKLGFVVDVNVETVNGKPIAYRIVDVHDVIELPDD